MHGYSEDSYLPPFCLRFAGFREKACRERRLLTDNGCRAMRLALLTQSSEVKKKDIFHQYVIYRRAIGDSLRPALSCMWFSVFSHVRAPSISHILLTEFLVPGIFTHLGYTYKNAKKARQN